MLAETFPEMRSMHPGELQIEDLPSLRNFVVVDNAEEAREDLAKLHIQSMVDWREIPIWNESAREARIQTEMEKNLHRDDIVNLQFTRYAYQECECEYRLMSDIVGRQGCQKPFQ